MTVPPVSLRRFGAGLSILAALVAAPGLGAQAVAIDTAMARPLTLGDAARLGARQSAAALAALARADQASARVRQSRADLLPKLSGYVSEASNTLNTATFGFTLPGLNPKGELLGPVRLLDVRGQATQTIVDLSAYSRVRSARSAANASSLSARDVAEQSAAIAANAYLRTQRADALVTARAADSVLADSLLSIARDQLAAGVGVALDVTRAEAQVASARAQLITARNERDRARLDLLRALGLPLNANVTLADSLAGLSLRDTIPNEADAIAIALEQRPDLRAARAQLLAARQSVTAVRDERLPSLQAFGNDGWLGINSGYKLNTYLWGVQLSIPIFDGLRREGRIEENEAAVREIDVRLRDLQQQAAIEVRGALLDLASAHQEVDAAREQLRLAVQEVAQARDRFTAGVSGNADVITASLGLNTARTQYVDALAAYEAARVALASAEGSVTSLR